MKYKKISASLAALLAEYQTQGAAAMSIAARAIPLAMAGPGSAPQVSLFLRCRENAQFDHLPGVKVNAPRGKVRTAWVTLDSVDALSEESSVIRLSPARQLRPLNDVAASKTRLPLLQGPPANLTGKGVIVGIVDTGIDPTHPSFAGRLLSIWDQTITGTGWGTTNYGTVLSGPTLAVSSDMDGHGTHVAGTAAGQHTSFGGVAPEADLIIVKTDFQTTSIGDGIRYVFAEADKLNRPAVVNLSLGGHFDAHDGSDDLSELINQLSKAGRIVVAAAGNEGTDDIHAEAIIKPGKTAQISFRVPPNSQPGATPWVVFNGWYDAAVKCEIAIRTSSGNLTAFQPVITTGNPTRITTFTNAVVRLTTPPPTTTINGDHQFLAELSPGAFSGLVQGGIWQVRIRNKGTSQVRVNIWSLFPSSAQVVQFQPPFNNTTMKIGSPGSAAEAITVAAFTSRNTWTDATGASRAVGLTLDDIADFSSSGPLRNGGLKPDVAAPGAMIISARSRQSSPRPSDIINADFRINAGTSMACPFITGLVALLLQRTPTLTSAAIKTLLQNHSRVPGQGANTHHLQWGFGLIDAGGL